MKKKKADEVKKPTQIQIKGYQTIPPTEGLPINSNIPTHHADIINILFSNDGLALISFFSRAPGLNVEECRVSFSHALAKKIVDLVCQHLNYYPQSSAQQIEKQKE
ncbi:MAG: hypothetical protein L6246_03480 [Thermodesulfovibrionales bacterium]|nr:hypothetical protein [Thermodesulfovibrionales bacterium]